MAPFLNMELREAIVIASNLEQWLYTSVRRWQSSGLLTVRAVAQ